MNYNETLNYIHSLGRFSLPPTLDRMYAVLEKLSNPQNKFKSIHIAGTNGKGSVSAMLHSVFKKAGYKTGLFISPFIIDFTERIQVNGEYISEIELTKMAERVIKTEIKLNEFEFITAMAFLYFCEQNCDIVICETGLGGRLDATNTLGDKVAAVITKIGLDHTAILGETISEIANEKCGILKDCPTITSPYQEKKAFEVIKNKSKNLFLPDLNCLETPSEKCEDYTYIYKGQKYKLSLKGNYQIENSLIAIETVENCGFDISYNVIYAALADTYFPVRMETVSKNPLIIIDGAHNPDGAICLAEELKNTDGAVAIIGMMQDKDYEKVLEITLPFCKYAVTVAVENMMRSLSAQKLCETASKYCECETAKDYNEALKKAQIKSDGSPIFVFGSLYLAADIRKLF